MTDEEMVITSGGAWYVAWQAASWDYVRIRLLVGSTPVEFRISPAQAREMAALLLNGAAAIETHDRRPA